MKESMEKQLKVAVRKSLGERIKDVRIILNVTLEAFAQQIGVSKSTVSKWERGESVPSPDNLQKIAEIGDTTVEALLAVDAQQAATLVVGEGNDLLDIYELLQLKNVSIGYKGKELTPIEIDKLKVLIGLFFD